MVIILDSLHSIIIIASYILVTIIDQLWYTAILNLRHHANKKKSTHETYAQAFTAIYQASLHTAWFPQHVF